MSFRSIPQNRVINEYSPFGQHHTYLSAHPIEEMLKPEYFLSQCDVFKPGDRLRVVQVRDRDIHSRSNRALAYADLIVVASSRQAVELHLTADVAFLPQPAGEAPTREKRATERYIGSDGRVSWNVGKRMYDVHDGDRLVAEVTSKDEAWSIAKGEVPLPEAAEAA